ncbi:hypothetical protein V8E36_004160 [Tilletia maclaganii]
MDFSLNLIGAAELDSLPLAFIHPDSPNKRATSFIQGALALLGRLAQCGRLERLDIRLGIWALYRLQQVDGVEALSWASLERIVHSHQSLRALSLSLDVRPRMNNKDQHIQPLHLDRLLSEDYKQSPRRTLEFVWLSFPLAAVRANPNQLPLSFGALTKFDLTCASLEAEFESDHLLYLVAKLNPLLHTLGVAILDDDASALGKAARSDAAQKRQSLTSGALY